MKSTWENSRINSTKQQQNATKSLPQNTHKHNKNSKEQQAHNIHKAWTTWETKYKNGKAYLHQMWWQMKIWEELSNKILPSSFKLLSKTWRMGDQLAKKMPKMAIKGKTLNLTTLQPPWVEVTNSKSLVQKSEFILQWDIKVTQKVNQGNLGVGKCPQPNPIPLG